MIDTATAARALGVAAGNVSRAVAPLVGAGVVTETTGYSRNRVWQAPEVLAALDGFAARAGRRSTG